MDTDKTLEQLRANAEAAEVAVDAAKAAIEVKERDKGDVY